MVVSLVLSREEEKKMMMPEMDNFLANEKYSQNQRESRYPLYRNPYVLSFI
jgi:hypothetical protein